MRALILVLALTNCTTVDGVLKEAEIQYVDWGATSITPVDCAFFGDSFSQVIDTVVVTDRAFLDALDEAVRELSLADVSKEEDQITDIRIKATLRFSGGETDTLCMGSFRHIVLDNRIMSDSRALFSLVQGRLYPDLQQ